MFYANEVGDDPHPPAMGEVSSELRHIFRTGTMYVAEREGRVVAFAAAIVRDSVTYLTDLFVDPGEQSSRLGAALLSRIMPEDGTIRCTMSSTDYRALALYIRAGMRPQWPNVDLRATDLAVNALPRHGVEVHEAHADDPALVAWDTEIGGRSRPAEHTYWVREQRGVPLWVTRQGEIIGYAYVLLGAGTIGYPDACHVGPVGARAVDDAPACVWAAVEWARARAAILALDVPGPHPVLASLLDAGFRIEYVETFLSTAPAPFTDPCRYVGSGGSLF